MPHKEPVFTQTTDPAPSRAMRRRKKKHKASLKSALKQGPPKSAVSDSPRRGFDSSSRYRGVRR